MKQKRHTTEEIIRILRQAEGGKNVEAVCREHNVTATSYYRWKEEVRRDGTAGRPALPGTGAGKR
jgi:transposase-like protein